MALSSLDKVLLTVLASTWHTSDGRRFLQLYSGQGSSRRLLHADAVAVYMNGWRGRGGHRRRWNACLLHAEQLKKQWLTEGHHPGRKYYKIIPWNNYICNIFVIFFRLNEERFCKNSKINCF